MLIAVECHAGYRGEETPRRFFMGSREIRVVEVIDLWHGPDHRYFKIAGDDGATYILRHDEPTGRWELTMFERSGAAGREAHATAPSGHQA